MIVYRISNSVHSHDLSGAGAKRMGARWNSVGMPMLYTSGHISLAVLEMLVNTRFSDYATALDLMYIRLPEPHSPAMIELGNLKSGWTTDFEYTRFMGDAFIRQKKTLLLKVPSAVINEEFNYLANPLHPDFRKIKLLKTRSFWPDQRLFQL
jgi:RES domain-containing protein